MVLAPPYSAKEWAKRSPHTAHVVNLGDAAPRLAQAAHRQGVRLQDGTEGFSSQADGRCGACEHRGSATRVDCSVCGARTARDEGGAPGGIALRNAVHSTQAWAAASVAVDPG